MSIVGWNYEEKPVFVHDCEKCTFLMSIRWTNRKAVDVYKQCGEGKKTLIRFGNDGSDYCSGLDQKALIAGYAMYLLDI